jgi:hypothetical protein
MNRIGKDMINTLYETFAPYHLREYIPGNCDCCNFDNENENLHKKPLRELTEKDIMDYYYLAVSNLGDSKDFRHFLPRILELLVDESTTLLEPKILIDKLLDAKFNEWSNPEQVTLRSYFKNFSDTKNIKKIKRQLEKQILS